MTRGAYLLVLPLVFVSAAITAVSAYTAGATLKALLARMVVSAVLAGAAGFILWAWLLIKIQPQADLAVNGEGVKGVKVDIEVADADVGEPALQPLQTKEISEGEARIFPARNSPPPA
ncbi:MAG TPA: hypothetical protein DEA44_09870 [Firmicutes bacterium]|nr:hypothetical protein [Bacillota bacterium]HWR55605.1 hypothetical protein [Negativicutes bacterium]